MNLLVTGSRKSSLAGTWPGRIAVHFRRPSSCTRSLPTATQGGQADEGAWGGGKSKAPETLCPFFPVRTDRAVRKWHGPCPEQLVLWNSSGQACEESSGLLQEAGLAVKQTKPLQPVWQEKRRSDILKTRRGVARKHSCKIRSATARVDRSRRSYSRTM